MVNFKRLKPITKAIEFVNLNSQYMQYKEHSHYGIVIITDREPYKLFYPVGWFYEAGYFTWKSGTPFGKIPMLTTNNRFWGDIV